MVTAIVGFDVFDVLMTIIGSDVFSQVSCPSISNFKFVTAECTKVVLGVLLVAIIIVKF